MTLGRRMAAFIPFRSANGPEGRMTIEQTVEIPASHRLTFEIPRDIPEGRAKVALTIDLTTEGAEQNGAYSGFDAALAEIRELCKDSKLTVDSFLELRRKDLELEEAKYRRMFHKDKDEN
jgi:hypothetical protein